MIVFIKTDGTVINVAPSPVYQGSSLSGSLYLVAPFPPTNAVEVAFTLPNGERTQSYVMTAISSMQDVINKLDDNYSVWEWQSNNGEITALPGTVTAQFTVLFNGQIQTTSSVNFTVQEGVLPLPPSEPTANQWDLLIELYGNLSGRVTKLEQASNNSLVDFTCELIEKNGVGYYKYTKTYSSGSDVFFEVPIPNTSEGIAIEDGVVIIEFSEESVWVQDSSGYSLGFSPSQTTYETAEYQVQLFEKTTSEGNSGWSSVADSVFVGSDGSLLVTANEPYSGRIVIDGSKAYTNFANLLNEAVEQSQEAIDGLNNKLDKVTTTATQERVYAVDTQGNNVLRQTTTSGTPQTIPRRGADGNFNVNCDNPATDERCANLKWVKNYVANNGGGGGSDFDAFFTRDSLKLVDLSIPETGRGSENIPAGSKMIITSGASGRSGGTYTNGQFDIKTVANNNLLFSFRYSDTEVGGDVGNLTCYDVRTGTDSFTRCGFTLSDNSSGSYGTYIVFTTPMYYEFTEACYVEFSTGDDGDSPFDTAITIIKP